MLKTFVEEAAALASIVLFVGMIAVWAQVDSAALKLGRRARPGREKRGRRLERPVPRGQLGPEASPLAGESAVEVAVLPQAGDRSKPMIQKP